MKFKFKENINLYPDVGVLSKSKYHTSWDPFIRIFQNHGWKIHISCFHDNFNDILEKVSNYCFKNDISFKFVNSQEVLQWLLSKNANRSESGKFMTIYPFNKVEFTKIVRELYPLLKKYNGPYILSDKRYLDSKVIYYRYGIITSKIDNNIMKFPEGELEDKRVPFYIQPKYVNDPLEENTLSNLNDSTENILTTNYKDIEAIHFSNGGGIYKEFNLKKQKTLF